MKAWVLLARCTRLTDNAHRTTKGAHKLTVLPEQPEPSDTLADGPEDDRGEGSGSGNDELDLDEDEEDAPVGCPSPQGHSQPTERLLNHHICLF